MNIPQETTDIEKIAQTLYAGFKTVPICEYLYRKFRNMPYDAEIDTADYIKSYEDYPNHYISIGGFVTQVNDYDAVSVWARPGNNDKLETDYIEDQKFVQEFMGRTAELKEKILGNVPSYHLFMISKDLERDTKGSVRSVFEHYTAQADKEGAAIYLEAISEKAAKVYEYFGFRRLGDITFGTGEVNAAGYPDANGTGFTASFMVYYSGELPVKL